MFWRGETLKLVKHISVTMKKKIFLQKPYVRINQIYEEKCNSILILYCYAQTHSYLFEEKMLGFFQESLLVEKNFRSDRTPTKCTFYLVYTWWLLVQLSWDLSNLCGHQRSWIHYLLPGICASELLGCRSSYPSHFKLQYWCFASAQLVTTRKQTSKLQAGINVHVCCVFGGSEEF